MSENRDNVDIKYLLNLGAGPELDAKLHHVISKWEFRQEQDGSWQVLDPVLKEWEKPDPVSSVAGLAEGRLCEPNLQYEFCLTLDAKGVRCEGRADTLALAQCRLLLNTPFYLLRHKGKL